MRAIGLLAIAALTGAAAAQGTLTFNWSISDTGNGDGLIEPGESALLVLSAAMDPPAVGFAGSIYDILGISNWDTGTVDSYVNLMGELTDDGDLQANNDILGIESFQLPPAFNPNFDASNPADIYAITWTPNGYAPRIVGLGDRNHLNSDVYTDNFGTSVSYDLIEGTIRFQVVPTPSPVALLGLAALVRGRRRRR